MSLYQELYDDAHAAYRAGQLRIAAITFREAALRARQLKDEARWFSSTMWAARAEFGLGRQRIAQGLLLEAAPQLGVSKDYDRWQYAKLRLGILMRWRPRKRDLESLIAELERTQRSWARAPRQDVAECHSRLAAMRGDWSATLRYGEQAFQTYDHSRGGTVRYSAPILCAHASIRLQDFEAAEAWIAAMHVADDSQSGWEKQIRASQASGALALARARGAAMADLRQLLRRLQDDFHGIEDQWTGNSLRHDQLYVWLADAAHGDPAKRWHPARAACRLERRGGLDVHREYKQRMGLLDYRLACLRFVVGLPAVDEQHVAPPSGPLCIVLGGEYRRRAQRCWAALTRAARHAARLDGMLECSWRTEEVARRERWLLAIGEAHARASDRTHPRMRQGSARSLSGAPRA
jgi:hypothetical protein